MKKEVYTIWQNLWNSQIMYYSLKKALMCQSMNQYKKYSNNFTYRLCFDLYIFIFCFWQKCNERNTIFSLDLCCGWSYLQDFSWRICDEAISK